MTLSFTPWYAIAVVGVDTDHEEGLYPVAGEDISHGYNHNLKVLFNGFIHMLQF